MSEPVTIKLDIPPFASDERRLTLTFPIDVDRDEAVARWRAEAAKFGETTWGPTVDEVMLERIDVWGMVRPA